MNSIEKRDIISNNHTRSSYIIGDMDRKFLPASRKLADYEELCFSN